GEDGPMGADERGLDELAIRNLTAALVLATDECSDDELGTRYGGCFAVDAVVEVGGDRAETRDGVVAAAGARRQKGVSGPARGFRHVLGQQQVVVDGDKAVSEVVFALVTKGPPLALAATGRYHDVLRRGDDGWQIARRVVALD